jgi:hypothetical protein
MPTRLTILAGRRSQHRFPGQDIQPFGQASSVRCAQHTRAPSFSSQTQQLPFQNDSDYLADNGDRIVVLNSCPKLAAGHVTPPTSRRENRRRCSIGTCSGRGGDLAVRVATLF